MSPGDIPCMADMCRVSCQAMIRLLCYTINILLNLTLDNIFNRWGLGEQYALVFYRIDLYAHDHLLLLLLVQTGLVLAPLLALLHRQLGGRGWGRRELLLHRGPWLWLGEAEGGREEGGERGHGPRVLLAHDLHQGQPRHRVQGVGEARGQEPGQRQPRSSLAEAGQRREAGVREGAGAARAGEHERSLVIAPPGLPPVTLHCHRQIWRLAQILHLTFIRILK